MFSSIHNHTHIQTHPDIKEELKKKFKKLNLKGNLLNLFRKNNKSSIVDLPLEIWKTIFQYVDRVQDRTHIAMVCRKFKSLIHQINQQGPLPIFNFSLKARKQIARSNVHAYFEICQKGKLNRLNDIVFFSLDRRFRIQTVKDADQKQNDTIYAMSAAAGEGSLNSHVKPIKGLGSHKFLVAEYQKKEPSVFLQPKLNENMLLIFKDLVMILENLNCLKNLTANCNSSLTGESWQSIEMDIGFQELA